MAGDSGRVVEFDIRTPLDGATIRAHVQSALSRGLREVDVMAPREERLTIVANGPSALAAPLARKPSLAINNSLRLFIDRGLTPDFWIASDPQACVADYLRDAPHDTVYLVASKCHPAVFDTLRDRQVWLWHCAEQATLDLLVNRLVVPSQITVTLCALSLMPVLGFHRMDTWGWDGCYLHGRDHATAQAHSSANDITVELGSAPEQRFATTKTWAAEAQEAVRLFEGGGRDVRVCGDGMIAAILRRFSRA